MAMPQHVSDTTPHEPTTKAVSLTRTAFFFASPTGVVRCEARHVHRRCHDTSCDALEAQLAECARDRASARLLGAIPYDVKKPMALLVGTPVRAPVGPIRSQRPPLVTDQSEHHAWLRPSPAGYMAAVEACKRRIASDDLRKAVMARCVDLRLPCALDLSEVLERLWSAHPHAYTFAVDLGLAPNLAVPDAARARRRRKRTLLGASPELLVRKTGSRVISNPLAGSIARSADPLEDERRRTALLGSAKDQREHALVVEQLSDVLSVLCDELEVPRQPSLTCTGSMWHLSTRVEGRLKDPSLSSLRLARALHPTPAVCGTPTNAARSLIAAHEPFDREFFTGTVGYCLPNGDGEWAVTIRCAQVAGRHVRLYAGAGIVADSDAYSELLETRAKLDTMLVALGLSGALQVP